MAARAPLSARSLSTAGATLPEWEETRYRLMDSQFYWLATVRPDGRPHVMPVLALWLDDALYFSAGPTTRKGRNLADEPRCAVSVDSDDLHLVVEGEAAPVQDETMLRRVAAAYASKYGWQATARAGALYGDGAPTAGPPPYAVYALSPTTVYAFGTDEAYGAVRWRFTRDRAVQLQTVATGRLTCQDH